MSDSLKQMITGFEMGLDQNADAVLIELRSAADEIERLLELIAKAGPLHWVMHEDIDGAREWEIEAARALEEIGGEDE